MYSVVWKYKIDPDKKDSFETEYGSSGKWNMLFSESKNYQGSILLRSEEEKDMYILIDTWTDKESYENFKKINAGLYNQLSNSFRNIYESELLLGTFYHIE